MSALPSKPFFIAPNDQLSYAWDWTSWLAGRGNDTIDTATVTCVGLSVGDQNVSGNIVSATFAGGTDGDSYVANCQIVTGTGAIANSEAVFVCTGDAR